MHVCIRLRLFLKTHLTWLKQYACLALAHVVLNNAFYLAYAVYMPFPIGLRPLNDAYQFKSANVSMILFVVLISLLI